MIGHEFKLDKNKVLKKGSMLHMEVALEKNLWHNYEVEEAT